MTEPRRAVAAILAALLLLSVASTVGVAIKDPELSAYVPSPNLEPGTTTNLTVQLVNSDDDGDPVLTAEDLRATLESGDSPIDVQSGTIVADDIEDGGVASVDFRVRVPAGTEPGTYRLPVDLEYVAEDETVERTVYVEVRVRRAPRFQVVAAETTAGVGDRGTLAVVLRNAGSAPASDTTLTLESGDPALTFGGGNVAQSFVGRVEPGEEARVDVSMDVAEGAAVRPYAVQATVAYEDSRGEQRSRTFPVSVTPRGEPTFAVSSVEADLRVGGQGTIQVVVENTGETVARDATVRLSVPWANVTTPAGGSLEYPVGDLEAGATAEARFTTDVPAGVEPGPRRLALRVEHTTESGARRLAEPIGVRVDVGPRRSPIAVEPVNATYEVDGGGRLEVELTNRGDGPITDLRATLTATEPLSSNDPSAYVPRLGVGESTTVAFDLDVSDDAVPGSHPVSVSLTYDDANGNARSVEGETVGVTVVEQPGTGFPVAAVVVVVLAIAAGAFWWYRRR